MKIPIKILIVEDEYIIAKTLSVFLENTGYTVVACAMSIEEALLYLKNEIINFVVLDINLNDERDGIWLANQIKNTYDYHLYILPHIQMNIQFKKQLNPVHMVF